MVLQLKTERGKKWVTIKLESEMEVVPQKVHINEVKQAIRAEEYYLGRNVPNRYCDKDQNDN